MSASQSKKERQKLAAMGPTQKQIDEQIAAQKARRNRMIFIIIGAVAVVIVAALLFWDSGVIQRNATAVTIGDRDYTTVDVDFYYNSAYSSYSSYATMYNLDPTKGLDEQELYEGYTWHDMLTETALQSMTDVAIVCQEAEKAGYTLSEEGLALVEENIEWVEAYASVYGTTTSAFLRTNYGEYITMNDFRRIITEQELYNEYADYITENIEVTDTDIDTYYSENSAALDTLDYECYLLTATGTTAEETAADLEVCSEDADEILAAFEAGNSSRAASLADAADAEDYSGVSYYSNMSFGSWLLDPARKSGDCTIIENTGADGSVLGYFVVYFNDRYLDEYCPVTVRTIKIAAAADENGNYDMDAARATIDEVEEGWLNSGGSEEMFISLVATYSADSATYPEGLRENVTKNTFPEEVNEWLFDPARKAGDHQIVEDDIAHTVTLIYYVEADDTYYWRSLAENALRSEGYNEWITALRESYTVTEGSGMRYVG